MQYRLVCLSSIERKDVSAPEFNVIEMNILAHMYSGFVTVKKPWWKNEYKRFYVAYTLLQAVADQCTFKYSINCFLMDVYKLMDKSRATNKYQILPGIYVVKDDTSGGDAIDLVQRAVISNQTELLDVYVQKKLNAYLDALSLSVKIMDRNSAISVRKFSDNFITELLPTINTGTRCNRFFLWYFYSNICLVLLN